MNHENLPFNLAFKNSNGKYICCFHGDDIMTNNSLNDRVVKLIGFEETLSAKIDAIRQIKHINIFNFLLILFLL